MRLFGSVAPGLGKCYKAKRASGDCSAPKEPHPKLLGHDSKQLLHFGLDDTIGHCGGLLGILGAFGLVLEAHGRPALAWIKRLWLCLHQLCRPCAA